MGGLSFANFSLPSNYLSMRCVAVLFFSLWMTGSLSVEAETISASFDADTYYYTQTYSTARTGTLNSGTFHVGMHILNTNPNYDGHFNFASVEFSDLSGLTTESTKFLQLNLKDFKTPGAIIPGYQGPPMYDYLATGSFSLAVVALGADFSESETATLSTWYQNNLFGRSRIAEVDLSQAGQVKIDVTSTVNEWILNPSANFGFGLVGITSSPLATTARFYSMENSSGLGPVLLAIPEPSSFALLWVGVGWMISRKLRLSSLSNR
jgi:hypothetical protein